VTMAIPARGRHSVKRRNADLKAQLAQERDDNRQLIASNEDLVCALSQSVIRGMQDAVTIAELRAENKAVKAANEDLRRATIRAKAEQERLRRAVVNARPRITEVPTALVRPYSPVVQLPYTSPVPYRDTSCDATQQLPILDQPQPWPTYTASH
jgi:hypothetical protein